MSPQRRPFNDTDYTGAQTIERRRYRSHTLTQIGTTPRIRQGVCVNPHSATCLARRGATCTCRETATPAEQRA